MNVQMHVLHVDWNRRGKQQSVDSFFFHANVFIQLFHCELPNLLGNFLIHIHGHSGAGLANALCVAALFKGLVHVRIVEKSVCMKWLFPATRRSFGNRPLFRFRILHVLRATGA